MKSISLIAAALITVSGVAFASTPQTAMCGKDKLDSKIECCYNNKIYTTGATLKTGKHTTIECQAAVPSDETSFTGHHYANWKKD